MELRQKRVIILGLGTSGISAARLCLARGARVQGTDTLPLEKLSPVLESLEIEIAAGSHAGVRFDQADLVVVSPGVPALPELATAEAAGVEVIGEMELAARFITAPIVAVGGTNGKSTTATLLERICEAAEQLTFAGANLGTPACDAVGGDWDVVVFEVSSFQLERAPEFHPRVSVLLNVTEDHLDRYSSFDDYARAKGNAFVNQGPDDFAVVPQGDAACAAQARRGRGRLVTFGAGGDYDVSSRLIRERETGVVFDLGSVDLHGRHNLDNAAAAVAAARALGIGQEAILDGLGHFVPLGHRMVRVTEIRGVTFYDDSKGTNVGASVTALSGLSEERAVLIVGGRDKHGSYGPLLEALERKGRGVVVIGEAAAKIAEAVGDRLPVEHASAMDQAVGAAFRMARPGDAVLLSPACSSFDMFRSYAERGDRFVQAVKDLAARETERHGEASR